jgi:hypothetical protein
MKALEVEDLKKAVAEMTKDEYTTSINLFSRIN